MSAYGGKALNFLMKKTWHPATFWNQEKVWLAEQKKAKEDQKLQEIQRQLQEEREMEELKKLQAEAGLAPKRAQRLEWMYQPGIGVGAAKPSTEEYLTGKEYKAEEEKDAVTEMQESQAPGSKLLAPGLNTENEKWTRVHNDPLVDIKRREMEALAAIRQNPVRMGLIRKSLGTGEGEHKSKDKDKDKKKRHKRAHSGDSGGEASGGEHRHRHRHRHHRKADADEWVERTPSHDHDHDHDHGHLHRKADIDRSRYGLQMTEAAHARRSTREHDDKDDDEATRAYREHRARRAAEEGPRAQYKAQWDEQRQRFVRPPPPRNRARGMTDGEREQRLAAMQSDAHVHEARRHDRLRRADAAEAAETAPRGSGGDDSGADFLRKMEKDVYSGGAGRMEDRLRRNVHHIQRGADGPDA